METNAKRTERSFEMKITNAGAAQSSRGFGVGGDVTTGNGTGAEQRWNRGRVHGQEVGSSAFCGSKIKCVCVNFGGMGAKLAVRPHPLLQGSAPSYYPIPGCPPCPPCHTSCRYRGTAAACVDCYFIASAWSQRHGPKQKLFASVRGWNLISSSKPRHHNIPAHSHSKCPIPASPAFPGKLLRLSLARKLANNFAIKMRAQKSPQIQFVTVCC